MPKCSLCGKFHYGEDKCPQQKLRTFTPLSETEKKPELPRYYRVKNADRDKNEKESFQKIEAEEEIIK